MDYIGTKRNPIYLCHFCGNKDPYLDFWKLILLCLFGNWKHFLIYFCWVTDFKFEDFTAKNSIIQDSRIPWLLSCYVNFWENGGWRQTFIFIFIFYSSILTKIDISYDHKDNSDGMTLNLNLTLNKNLTLDDLEILIFRGLK